MKDFTEFLFQSGKHLTVDGAMGTMLYQKGIVPHKSFELLNIDQPKLVREIHREYIHAGARLLFSNSFGANRFRLAKHSLVERLEEINRASVRLVREAAELEKQEIWVAGSLGPVGQSVAPYGLVKTEEVEACFHEQAKVLLDEGVDLLVLETFLSVTEAKYALLGVARAKEEVNSRTPVALLFSFNHEGKCDTGRSAAQVASEFEELPVDIVGANCSSGPQSVLKALQQMAAVTKKPLFAKPNAGLPKMMDGRLMYMATPDYFLTFTKRLLKVGVRFIGGCCGSTPEHIKSVANCIKAYGYDKEDEHIISVAETEEKDVRLPPVPLAEKSAFAKSLAEGKFVVSVEILPPRGADPSKVIANVKRLKEMGVDAVNIPDGPRASARMSSLALGQLLKRDVGIESILHYTCRDRNLLGMQSDLLGTNAIGVHNVLAITGDPPKLGNYPDATAVYDVDSIGLVKIMNNLNHGVDLVGNSIGSTTALCIGVAANPGSLDMDLEVERLQRKVENGAEFIMTQPVFDAEYLNAFLERIKDFRIPMLVGILPIASNKAAEFMHNEVPGMQLPEHIRKRMREAPEGDAAKEEGIAIAREALQGTKGLVEGAYIMAPAGGVATAMRVIEGIL